ncbi:hypothetical protein Bca52824_049294 [Brassica carinata]|uniref:Uncharacterized protein n=1 Tax=Brassica carinata TaxID=52824 RepID=A0A8X7RMU2_BRACI|nr:hypothetical protein Bca52824_049294 [Brassica carinata]
MLQFSGPTIETPLQQPPLDAGEAFGRRRRALRSGSLRLPCLCFVFTIYTSSSTWCSVNVKISPHANIPLWRKLFAASRSFCLFHYRSGSTDLTFSGVPQPVRASGGSIAVLHQPRFATTLTFFSTNYHPLLGSTPSAVISATRPLRFAGSSSSVKKLRYLPLSRLILPAVGQRPEPTTPPPSHQAYPGRSPVAASSARLSSSRRGYVSNMLGMSLHLLKLGLGSPIVFNYQWPRPLLSLPTMLWGYLVSLINCLKVIYEFTGVGTEAGLHITMHLSCVKSLLSSPLPVGLPGPSSSPLAYFSLEKRTAISTTSLLRSVSLPNVKWKCPPIFIAILLSCVAVRLGPEDATDFVSTILRGADWVFIDAFELRLEFTVIFS